MLNRDFLGVFLFFFPLILKWILPSGIEQALYVQLFGFIPLFPANLTLLVAPFFLVHVKGYGLLKTLLLIDLVWILCLAIMHNIPFEILISGSFYIYAFFYLCFFKFSEKQVQYIDKLLFFPLTYIFVQIILYSLGLSNNDMFAGNMSFAGVLRISTSAGPATASACIVAVSGMLIVTITKNKWIKFSTLLMMLISGSFLMSRMPFLCILLFILFVLFYGKIGKKNMIICSLLLVVSVYFGILNPVLERALSKTSKDFDSNRAALINKTMQDYEMDGKVGLGVGNVYVSTEINYFINDIEKPMFWGAPHNSYVLLLCEQGFLGLFVLSLFFVLLFKEMFLTSKKLFFVLLLIFSTLFNSETVVITNSEHVFLIASVVMIAPLRTTRRNILCQKC